MGGSYWCNFTMVDVGGDVWLKYKQALDGTEYVEGKTMYRCKLPIADAIAQRFTTAGLRLDIAPSLAAVLQTYRANIANKGEAADRRATEVDALLRDRGLALFPFQRFGVGWLAGRDGAILADDMGLGKTIQALIAAASGAPVLVLCPKVAKGVWCGEASRWRPDLIPITLDGRGSFRWPRPGELVAINYDVLSESRSDCPHCRVTPEKPCPNRCVNLGAAPKNLVIICDESHVLMNGKTGRTRRTRSLIRAARIAGGSLVWLLTATPMLNRPTELWSLLCTIGRAQQVFGNWETFLITVGARQTPTGIRCNPDKIAKGIIGVRLKECLLRRLKKDVLVDLPAKLVEVVDVDLDREAARELAQVRHELLANGVDINKALAAAIKTGCAGDDSGVGVIAKMRSILAVAKLGAVIDMVDELEAAAEVVVVFSSHRAPLIQLAKRPGWARIDGSTSADERTAIARKFQAGELKGLAANTIAAGVALTLTRASEAIFIDPDWRPAMNSQAEDRIYRIGTMRAVRIRYCKADHVVDDLVFEALRIKRELIARVVDVAVVAPPTTERQAS
jgi:SWI/SNF-related matrix-associated actin-dependent regulator 1 of chromatin subfamily A